MESIQYVGSPEIHDAVIQRIENTPEAVTVFLKSYEGRHFGVRFDGVASLEAHEAEEMMLYALIEMCWTPPLRKFIFGNWDEEDAARLEIIAEGFEMLDTVSHPAEN